MIDGFLRNRIRKHWKRTKNMRKHKTCASDNVMFNACCTAIVLYLLCTLYYCHTVHLALFYDDRKTVYWPYTYLRNILSGICALGVTKKKKILYILDNNIVPNKYSIYTPKFVYFTWIVFALFLQIIIIIIIHLRITTKNVQYVFF